MEASLISCYIFELGDVLLQEPLPACLQFQIQFHQSLATDRWIPSDVHRRYVAVFEAKSAVEIARDDEFLMSCTHGEWCNLDVRSLAVMSGMFADLAKLSVRAEVCPFSTLAISISLQN